MNISTLIFWPVFAMTLAGAAGCAFARNLVYAALSLGVSLAGVAGIYFFLQAEYLAVIQMIVYVGGILILILFGVMFSRDILGTSSQPSWGSRLLGGAASLLVLATMGKLAWSVSQLGDTGLQAVRSSTSSWVGQISSSSVTHLGDLLMGEWLVSFLVIAVLLTVVLIAALGLVRKDAQ